MGDGKKGSGKIAANLSREKVNKMIVEMRAYYANAQGKRAQNVMHYQSESAPSSTDPYQIASQFASGFDSVIETLLTSCLCPDTVLSAYSSKVADGSGGPTFSEGIGVPGTQTGHSLSMLVAANIALLPGTPPYKRKIGHIFVPAMPETFCDGDLLTTIGDAFYGALANGFSLPVTAAGVQWQMVIFDRTTKTGTPISDFVIKPNVSGHRRRLRPVVA